MKKCKGAVEGYLQSLCGKDICCKECKDACMTACLIKNCKEEVEAE